MRVITGKAKGHKLSTPSGLKTRPTSDRVKEAIFNIIHDIVEDDVVLDLYAGSGSIGIEFLSRGAQKCVFIDRSINSIKVIKQNLIKTNLINNSTVMKMDAFNAIKKLGKKNYKFSYIFMDPPYKKNLVISTLNTIYESKALKDNGLIIIEHESDSNICDNNSKYEKIDMRKYGNTCVSFYNMRR